MIPANYQLDGISWWMWVLLQLLSMSGCLFFLWENSRLRSLNEELRRMAFSFSLDTLTGLPNRASLAGWIDSQTSLEGVAVLIDINDFKLVNDSLGHDAGDEVISSVGRLIHSSIRRDDFACRYGGDEFVVIFVGESVERARERMTQIEERLLQFRLRNTGKRHPIRLSYGIAEMGSTGVFDAIHIADELMYRQKTWRKQVASKAVPAAVTMVRP